MVSLFAKSVFFTETIGYNLRFSIINVIIFVPYYRLAIEEKNYKK